MSDIDLLQNIDGLLDIDFDNLDLMQENGLRTAIILSLLIDRRADDDDDIPDGTDNKRGWWADAYPPTDGDQIGSKLWLLSRDKDLATVRRLAETYAEESLAWLIEDGIASSVQVQAETVPPVMLLLNITVVRSTGDVVQEQYQYVWEAS